MIPAEGEEGFIEDKDSLKVLGIKGIENGTDLEVVLENKIEPPTASQKWIRGLAYTSGYFSFINPITGKVLTRINETKLNIRGILDFIFSIN